MSIEVHDEINHGLNVILWTVMWAMLSLVVTGLIAETELVRWA